MPDTLVSFPSSALTGSGRVVAVASPGPGRLVVATDATPFHPVDHTWPDQPGDHGTLTTPTGLALPVLDCVTCGLDEAGGDLVVGEALPVKRGTPGWSFLVGHVVAVPADVAPPVVGGQVTLEVDAGRRAALSLAHTACHLAAFALNEVVAGMWRKEAPVDSLGHPDFDRLALTRSVMDESGSLDEYRLGKSLRKKGFAADELAGSLDDVGRRVAELLAAWVAAGGEVRVDAEGPGLTDLRRFRATLPEGVAEVLCGGTHVSDVRELGDVTVGYELTETGDQLVVRTTAAG